MATEVGDEPTSDRFVVHPEALCRALPDGVLVLAPGADEVAMITAPGPLIWTLLSSPRSRTEVGAALAREFGAPEETVARDLAPVWAHLVEIGAVVSEP